MLFKPYSTPYHGFILLPSSCTPLRHRSLVLLARRLPNLDVSALFSLPLSLFPHVHTGRTFFPAAENVLLSRSPPRGWRAPSLLHFRDPACRTRSLFFGEYPICHPDSLAQIPSLLHGHPHKLAKSHAQCNCTIRRRLSTVLVVPSYLTGQRTTWKGNTRSSTWLDRGGDWRMRSRHLSPGYMCSATKHA